MSDSIWKKDISFGRKRKDEDLPETPESLRVKQLAFQQKLAEAAQVVAPPVAPAPVEDAPKKQSIWKKEIGGKRKTAAEAPPAPVEDAPKKQSIWKKEIGGKRKPADEPIAVAPPAPAPVAEFVAPASVVVEPPAPAPVAEFVAPAPIAAEPPAPAPVAEFVAPAPIAVDPPAPAPAPEVLDYEPPAEIVLPGFSPEPESIWKKEISFRRKPAEQPAPAQAAAASGDGPPEPPVSIWKKEISFKRKHDEGAEPQEKSESIWTKDISLRRKQARSAQVRALAEEALQAIDAASTAEPWLAEPELPPAPLPEPQAAPAAPAPAPPPAPAAEKPKKTSIWKRELGGSKKAKEPKAEKPAKAEKQAKEPKQKRRLRDVKISLPKSSPKVHAGGGSGGSHAVKRLVGLKIGASQLAAARVNNNGAAELVQVARQSLEQGVVVGGEVRDPEALAVALKQFFAKNKLPRKNVRLGIASNRIGVRIFDLVGIDDDKQLENAIRFRAQETLPIPLDEAVLDYHVLGESTDEDGTTLQRVLLVVAYRELVDRYVSACKKAGITLAGVDLEAFALLRALAAPRGEEVESDSALVAVSIGHDRSTF
ncbi:MAG TPA: pilus assembly protein PilM, partial [Gaiellaceae bacterium]